MKLIDIIKNDNGNEFVVSRYENSSIPNKSILSVLESEQAIFIRDGVIVQVFTGGRHVLTSAQYPLLFNEQKRFTGGKSITNSSLIFVKTNNLTEIKWGTDSPIPMLDAKYGFTVNVRANGTYSAKVDHAEKLLIKLLGLDVGNLTKAQVSSYF